MSPTPEQRDVESVQKALVHAALHGDAVVDPAAVLVACQAPNAEKPALLAAIVKEAGSLALLRHVANNRTDTEGAANLFQTGFEATYTPDQELLEAMPRNALLQYGLIPMRRNADNKLFVVAAKPDTNVKELMRKHAGDEPYKYILALGSEIRQKLNNVKSSYAAVATERTQAAEAAQTGPASRAEEWVQNLLRNAVNAGASDIHILQDNSGIQVRMRIDDILRAQPAPNGPPKEYVTALLTKVSGVDATERRVPQDGSLTFDSGLGRDFDSRVATCPTVDSGISVTIRLLDPLNIERKLSDSGFTAKQLAVLEGPNGTAGSQGLIVVSGPTGSGKTTTLYSLIRNIAGPDTKTITVEDPVEYRLDYIDQVEVYRHPGDPSKSLTFERALRSILRSDPDNVLVGEIRDEETAQMTLDAAITGHLVLSTVHTRNAAGIYSRLAEMNRPLYMIAEALSLGVAQRLARRLHQACATTRPIEASERAQFEEYGMAAPETVRVPTGCGDCTDGYKGRIGIAEVLEPTVGVKELVLSGATAEQIEDYARKEDGFETMFEVGLTHVVAGTTDLLEVNRVITQ